MSIKLKCILLDDEIPGLTYLKMLCEQINEVEVVKAFNDPQRLVAEAALLDFDLCILDIEMPHLNGLQVANLLRNKLVIFTTAYTDYAADAFDLYAVDYVRKPVQKERLHQAIQKAIDRRSARGRARDHILVNTDHGKTLINLQDLAFVTTSEVDSRDKIAFLLDGSSHLLKNISFENLQAMLPPASFCRVNRKQLIAMKIVTSYTFNEISTSIFVQGKAVRVPLNEVYRQRFQDLAGSLS